MKAEHRKELQTNALADRMGRMVKRVKTGPSRRTILGIVLAVVVVVIYLVWQFNANRKRTEMSTLWTKVAEERLLGLTRDGKLHYLLADYRDTNPDLAARFQRAWALLWEGQPFSQGNNLVVRGGLKGLAADPMVAMYTIKDAEKMFSQLSMECKDDPVLGPEAAYALAVIEESKTVEDQASLDKAIGLYKGVQSRFKDSAAGAAAGKRAEYLEKNRTQVEDFYKFMNQHLAIFSPRQQMEPPPPEPVKVPDKK